MFQLSTNMPIGILELKGCMLGMPALVTFVLVNDDAMPMIFVHTIMPIVGILELKGCMLGMPAFVTFVLVNDH